MRSLVKFASLAAGMILLMAAVRGLTAVSEDRNSMVLLLDATMLLIVFLLMLGQGLVGGMAVLLAWRRLSRGALIATDGDHRATEVLVAKWIQQQTELRLVIALGTGLLVLTLGVVMGIWLAPGYAAAAQVIAIFFDSMLAVVLATTGRRETRWAAGAALVLVVLVLGFCVTFLAQMQLAEALG